MLTSSSFIVVALARLTSSSIVVVIDFEMLLEGEIAKNFEALSDFGMGAPRLLSSFPKIWLLPLAEGTQCRL